MVQFIPARNDWAGAFQNLGQGVSEGYMNQSDQMAIQKALEGIPKQASMRDILDTISKTNTYGSQAKNEALSNFAKSYGIDLEQERFKEQQRANLALEKHREESLKVDLAKIKKDTKREEKNHIIRSALQTVKEMRDLGAQGHLGLGVGIRKYANPETARRAAQYEQSAKSLIQLVTDIPIRNKQEFEVMAHNIYDPSLMDSERAGILTSLENRLMRALIEDEEPATDQQKKVYYSKANGRPLKDLPEEQIQQLLQQGLITDVKPE